MKISDWKSLPSRHRKLIRWVAWLLLGYAVAGFLVLPPIVRRVAVRQLARQLDREVAIAKVRLNPFMLSATVRGLLIKDKDGQPFVSWDEVHVNFQLATLFSKAWIFREVSTTRPFARVQVNRDYTLNFSDLVTKFSKADAAAPKTPSAPFALRIKRLHIGGATARYTDLTVRTPFQRVIGPLDVSLDNFRTDPDNENPYAFAGTTDAGERFSWSGHFFLNPLRSRGELSLENISLNKYAPLYQDFVRFEIRDGTVSVRANYDFELSAAHRVMAVSNATFQLRFLKLAEPGGATNLAELARLVVEGANVDAVAHVAEVKSISGYGGRLVLKRDANAEVNVVELAKPPTTAAGAPGGILLLLRSVTNAVAMLLNSTNQWAGTIHNVSLWQNSLSLEDLVNSRPARLELDNLELAATNISNLPGANLSAALSLRWNTNGTIKSGMTLALAPTAADVELAIDGLDLHPLDPYLESKVNLIVLGSKLGLHGQVRLRTPTNGLPKVTFAGDARLDDLSTVDGVLGEDLLAWKSVRLSGINANLNPPEVAIGEIAVDDASARIVVETNRTINLRAALNAGGTNAPLPATNAPATAGPAPGPLPKISIASVVISNGQVRLTDRSVSPVVNLALQGLGGTIAGLSSDDLQHADVNLHANINGGAPVEITGTINPLAHNQTSDLKVTMKNLDLTPASPYSGRFAGYRITKGKLGVDLAYQLADRKLKAANLITLDQFTFGERVESPDATKLPVKLAIAILKDREGKIVLDVPIEGSLDDPQFHLGKVISRAILNIIVKIATSPFSVLGAIFGGGGEELSYQDFAPGSAELQAAETNKLAGLVQGLYERPALQVAIEGSVDAAADLDGLRRIKLEEQLRQLKWQSLRKAARAGMKPEEIVLLADERAGLLKQFLRQALAAGPGASPVTNRIQNAAATSTNRVPVAAPERFLKTGSDKGAVALAQGADTRLLQSAATATATAPVPAGKTGGVDVVEQVALATIAVSDSEFAALATARALAVKQYLLQSGKIEAERIFLTGNQELKTEGGRAYLQLQ
jgi:hypothetical protein